MKGMKDSVQVSTPNMHHLDLSHTINTTFDFYQFRPVFIQTMYPKDHLSVSLFDYFRAEPLAGAVYGRFFKKYAAFFVPYRILWDKWNDFLTGGSSGKLEFDVPQISLDDIRQISTKMYDQSSEEENLEDVFQYQAVYRHMLDYWKDCGLPSELFFEESFTDSATDFVELDEFRFPLFNFLACRRIWFDWFRDQNLIGDDVEDDYCPKDVTGFIQQQTDPRWYKSFQPYKTTLLSPLPIPLEKDYFTTAALEPQRGVASFVPVQLPSVDVNAGAYQGDSNVAGVSTNAEGSFIFGFGELQDGQVQVSQSANDIIGMFDYNLIRTAKGVQKYLEKNNVAGGATLQQLLAHWGTAPNPAVFQRSTFIGSFHDDMTLSEVTSPMDAGSSSAGEVATKLNMSGKGNFDYTANEHGLFIIVQFARPENSYVGGIRREFMKGLLGNGRFDFFTPELEKTGFQPMYAWEKTSSVFRNLNEGQPKPDHTVGFVPRYAEDKRQYNEYRGQLAFRSADNYRITREYADLNQISDNEISINTDFTSVYGYPVTLQYDRFFEKVTPHLDHFSGWIHFDVDLETTRNDYAAPLIEDSKGNDITLPYMGVRM